MTVKELTRVPSFWTPSTRHHLTAYFSKGVFGS